jgi:hypothetical protein
MLQCLLHFYRLLLLPNLQPLLHQTLRLNTHHYLPQHLISLPLPSALPNICQQKTLPQVVPKLQRWLLHL